MKYKALLLILISIISAALLTSCVGGGVNTASSWPGVSADQETAYLAYNQYVYAINLSNGLEKWRFPLEGKNNLSFFASPTLTDDGQLLVGDYSNTLHSINPANGQENWSFTGATDRYISAPLVAKGSIFAPNAANHIFALDLQGNLLWTFDTGGPLWAQPTTNEACDCIYVPSMDHHVYAVNARTGASEWQSEDLGGSIVGKVAFGQDGILYTGTFASEVVAINAEDGKVIWRTAVADWVWGGPIVKEDRLYLGDRGGTVYALDAKSGAIIWQQKPDGPTTESPLVTQDRLYITTETGRFYAFDLDGNISWNKEFNGKLNTSPVLAGDKILLAVAGSEELLYAFDSSGNQVWAFLPEKKD